MNWFTHGRTSKSVGFGEEGGVCEGGACEHLQPGDLAYGHTSENDSMGSEMYLLCNPCYMNHLEERRTEPVDCSDCGKEVPRCDTISHTPYFVDEYPREKWTKTICKECQTGPKHLRRLEVDEEEKSHDQDAQDDWFDQHGPDDEPDDEEEIPDDQFESFDDPRVSHLPLTIFSRKAMPKDWPNVYSNTIQSIVISERK